MVSPLRKFKDEKDLTYSDLCKIFGVSSSLIYKNLHGISKNLSPVIKENLAELQGVKPEELEQAHKEFRKQEKARLIN